MAVTRPLSQVLSDRIRELLSDEEIALQLRDIVKGVTRKTTYQTRFNKETDAYERFEVAVTEQTDPEDQLRGLVVLDIIRDGEVGIARAATVHRELPSRKYDRWVRMPDRRIVSSAEAFAQVSGDQKELVVIDVPLCDRPALSDDVDDDRG